MSAPINDNLRVRLGAAVLALATLAAIVFGIINFQQRSMFTAPDDGVSWIDKQSAVVHGTSPLILPPQMPDCVLVTASSQSTMLPIHSSDRCDKASVANRTVVPGPLPD